MSKTVAVTLAEREYTIQQLPIKASRVWRGQLAGPFTELVNVLEGAERIELNNAHDIAAVVRSLSGTLIGSIDLVLELLFAYSPELKKDREYIEQHAYDDEAMAAFTEVLRLAYPFGILLALGNGRPAKRT